MEDVLAKQRELGLQQTEEMSAKMEQQQRELEERNHEIQLKQLEMEKKEAAAQKKLEEMQELQRRNQQNEQEKAAKKDLIMSIKAEIEPLIIEANEIAENIGKNIKFELQFAGIHQEDN